MRARVAAFAMLLVGLAGCSNKPAPTVVRPGGASIGQEIEFDTDDLSRELEAMVLESYLHVSLGNMEAFADMVVQDRESVLIGVQPGDLVVGTSSEARTRDRRLFRDRPHCGPSRADGEPCLRLVPKTLDVHLYADESVGWAIDEVSYRVPHDGREAAIPLRMTAVMVRDIDRWVLAMQHESYALSADQLVELARAGQLPAPASMRTHFEDRGRARLLKVLAEKRLNADDAARERRVRAMERKRERAARGDIDVVDESALSLLYTGPVDEYHGVDVHDAPSLAEVFGTGTRVTIDDYRLSVAANKRVAWMAANLTVALGREDVDIRLRGTFVFAFDSYGWNLMQAHVSAPVTEQQIAERYFSTSPTASRDAELARRR